MVYSAAGKVMSERLLEEPDNVSLFLSFAMVCHEMGDYEKAVASYERIIDLDPNHAMALNNLAWILVTAPNEGLRNKGRALELAKRAVAVKRSSVFLDTLAEAYYANGFVAEAVKTIKEAISVAKDNRGYYEKQLERFLSKDT
jgi:tetratricopeptide (TPR) repeat protein